MNSRSSKWALKIRMKESSRICWPRLSGSRIRLAVEEHRHGARVAVLPVGLLHLRARRREPRDVADLALAALGRGALEEPAAPEHRMVTPQRHHPLREREQLAHRSSRRPVRSTTARCPGSRRCCCRAGSGPSRRRAAIIGTPWDEQQGGEEVALLAVAQLDHLVVVGLALRPAVPRAVVALAVDAALAVRLVVLLVVGDEVAQREPVVGRDEVDARDRVPAVVLVEVAGAGDAGGELGERATARRARSRGRCPGTCRSTRSTAAGSSRPGSRPRRRPTARR